MKTCNACGQEKEMGEFYAHHKGSGGRMAICKDCHKSAVKANRAANKQYYSAFDRARADSPERVAARKAYQKAMKENPDLVARQQKRAKAWINRNTVKRRAHVMLGNALRDGVVARPCSCEQCGASEPLSGHHEDYYKPLDVVWLCKTCHGLRHREINELKRAGHDLSCRGF